MIEIATTTTNTLDAIISVPAKKVASATIIITAGSKNGAKPTMSNHGENSCLINDTGNTQATSMITETRMAVNSR